MGLSPTCPSCYSRGVTSRLVATALAGLALLTAGCDNNTATPTAPSSGALRVTAARSVLRTGEVAPLTVTTGAGVPVAAAMWSSSDGSVLGIGPTGIATAGRAGRVTVTVTAGTASGSLPLRVVPDYQGTWTGAVARPQLTCGAASAAALCGPGAATGGTMTLRVVQTGDQLTAVLTDSAEPTAQVPLTGQVTSDDQLALAGRLDTPALAPLVRVEVATFRGSLDVVLGTLTGNYQLNVDRVPASGGALQADYRAQVQYRNLARP